MACATGVYSVTLILFITWLLMKAEIDVCKKGNVSVSPARTISLGSTVNISCFLKPKQACSHTSDFQKLTFYRNHTRVHSRNKQMLSIQVSDLHIGTTLFVCKVSCGSREERPVCGVQVSVGVSPEQPHNLSCAQLGERGTVVCSWDKGRDSYLYTVHTLQLTGPNDLWVEKQCVSCHEDLDLGITLSPDSPEANYTARVVAVNDLGNSSSLPFVFSFTDIVKPLPPSDLRADFPHSLANLCTLHWQDPGPVMLNRLRFRPVYTRSWEMVHITNAGGKYKLNNLKPFTEYEFQISSKRHSRKGRWSDWSKLLRTRTPEKDPVGTLDVWYTKDDVEGGLQNISLYWKEMRAPGARGESLGYQVTFQEVPTNGPAVHPSLKYFTVHMFFTTIVPQKDYTAAVSAVDAKGPSPPTRILITHQPGAAPQNVAVKPWGTGGLGVTWEPPGEAATSIREYLLEWRELGASTPPITWLRLPSLNKSAVITEHIKPHLCYQLRLCALSERGAGCVDTWANLTSKEPLSGPHIRSIKVDKGTASITWDEIPAREQMGCLLYYRIYLQELTSNSEPQIFKIHYEVANTSGVIRDLQPRAYVLWMTAFTEAGEGPRGKEREFSLEDVPDWKMLVALSISLALLVVGIFSVPYSRAKVMSLISALKPYWSNQEIPDPANSTWAKKYSVMEKEMQFSFDNLSNNWTSSEEPETLEVKEVLQKAALTQRETHSSRWPRSHHLNEAEREVWLQAPKSPEVGAEYGVSHPSIPGTHWAEKGQASDLYKMMGSGGPGSKYPKVEDPVSQMGHITVDYLPANIDYLPSNLDYLPSVASDPLEGSEFQSLSFSIFPKGSFHPLICGEKLTLDRVKIDSGSVAL